MNIAANNYLAITALGPNDIELVAKFTQTLEYCGANILSSRMLTLGSEFAMLLLIEGNWGTVAKIEACLPTFEKNFNITTTISRTTPKSLITKTINYVAHIITIDKIGILQYLAQFFTEQNINIEEVNINTYNSYANTKMTAITININIEINMHLPSLREKFMNFCDSLNLDAGLEPARD